MTEAHTFHVRLDDFDGPLDLLLGLIKEQQLDVATVPLASVAEQYLAYVRTMQARDFEVAAEYLVIAATLLFLKSRALLPPTHVIGYLHSGSSSAYAPFVAAFREGLRELGYQEGQNVWIEFRWAKGRYSQLPALAADLVGRRVSVIVTQGGDPPPLAAKSATSTIPIVFTISSDPIKLGLVHRLVVHLRPSASEVLERRDE